MCVCGSLFLVVKKRKQQVQDGTTYPQDNKPILNCSSAPLVNVTLSQSISLVYLTLLRSSALLKNAILPGRKMTLPETISFCY